MIYVKLSNFRKDRATYVNTIELINIQKKTAKTISEPTVIKKIQKDFSED